MPANPSDRTDFGRPGGFDCRCGHDKVALVRGQPPIPHTRPEHCIDFLRLRARIMERAHHDLEALVAALGAHHGRVRMVPAGEFARRNQHLADDYSDADPGL